MLVDLDINGNGILTKLPQDVESFTIPASFIGEDGHEHLIKEVMIDQTSYLELNELKFSEDSQIEVINRFYAHFKGKSLEFPASLRIIKSNGISLSNLKKITFPPNSKLEHLYPSAFTYQTLQTLVLPAGIRCLHREQLTNMTNLKNLKFHGEPKYYVFDSNGYLYSRGLNRLVFIPKNGKKILIREGVEYLSPNIAEQMLIKSIFIPSSVVEISSCSFFNCRNLSRVTFGKNSRLKTIGRQAFQLTKIKKIQFPPSVETILDSFGSCDIEEIIFPPLSKCVNIGPFSFQGSKNIKKIVFPAGIKCIHKGQLSGLPNCTSISFAGTHNNYFVDSERIVYSRFPAGVIFVPCDKKHFIIRRGIEFIGNSALNYHSKLNNIHFPALKLLMKDAFLSSNIQRITFDRDTKNMEMEESVFRICMKIKTLHIHSGIKLGSMCFMSCINLVKVTFNPDFRGSILPIRVFSRCIRLKEVTIPDNIEEISSQAFSGCQSLEKIIFTKNSKLKIIGGGAFYSCIRIKEVSIPNTVEHIRMNAFNSCKSLERIFFKDYLKLRSADKTAFLDCPKLSIPEKISSFLTRISESI